MESPPALSAKLRGVERTAPAAPARPLQRCTSPRITTAPLQHTTTTDILEHSTHPSSTALPQYTPYVVQPTLSLYYYSLPLFLSACNCGCVSVVCGLCPVPSSSPSYAPFVERLSPVSLSVSCCPLIALPLYNGECPVPVFFFHDWRTSLSALPAEAALGHHRPVAATQPLPVLLSSHAALPPHPAAHTEPSSLFLSPAALCRCSAVPPHLRLLPFPLLLLDFFLLFFLRFSVLSSPAHVRPSRPRTQLHQRLRIWTAQLRPLQQPTPPRVRHRNTADTAPNQHYGTNPSFPPQLVTDASPCVVVRLTVWREGVC